MNDLIRPLHRRNQGYRMLVQISRETGLPDISDALARLPQSEYDPRLAQRVTGDQARNLADQLDDEIGLMTQAVEANTKVIPARLVAAFYRAIAR